MRYGKNHKREMRETIVRQAAARFRKDGLAAVGVRPLMTDAGLTHGGFYSHFASRDALVAEALESALGETLSSLTAAVAAAEPGKGLEAFIDSYLDPRHCTRPDKGCAGASLAPEIAREDEPVRRAFEQGIERIVLLLASQLPSRFNDAERRSRAHAIFAMLMGALQLARLALDPAEASAILSTARKSSLRLALD